MTSVADVQVVAAEAADAAWLLRVLGALDVPACAEDRAGVVRPTLLCVRDVRDLLATRLERAGGAADGVRLLSTPEEGPIPLPPAEAWALRTLVWVALADGTDVAVLRMEEVAAAPQTEVVRALAALGVQVAPERVASAIAASEMPPRGAARPDGVDRLPYFQGVVALALATLGYPASTEGLPGERRPPEAVGPDLATARERLAAGDATGALETLIAARARGAGADVPIALAAARLAATWTPALVVPGTVGSPQVGRVFDAVLAVLLRFAATPAFDAALFGAELATRAAAERTDPAAVRAARLRASGGATVSPAETSELFAAGNYTAVARVGSFDAWETYAAFGLLGRTEVALDGLARFDEPAARFWTGVTRFLDGDDAGALAVLADVPTEHARRLRALVEKPVIRVLAQVSWVRQGTQDYLSTTSGGGRFEVRNVSFDPRDVQNRPYADVHEFVDPAAPPDFFFTQMAEFHLLPPNLRALACPLLAQTSDYDLYIQSVYPRLREFDELVVSDQTEWAGVEGLVAAPVSSFPACLGVPAGLPALAAGERKVDVVFSGASVHPVYPEKARCLRALLDLPDAAVRVVNGYRWYREYVESLGQCKTTFTHIRRPGCVPSRGLEAIGMGCAVVVQRESTLTLFLGEEDGLCTYDLEAGDLASTVARILAHWDTYQQRARWGARIARRELGMARVADRFLRFLTVLAARPRPERRPPMLAPEWETSALVQRIGCSWRGPDVLPGHMAERLLEENLHRWRAAGDDSAVTLNDVARELVLSRGGEHGGVGSPSRDRLVGQGIALYHDAVARHPDRLILRFNLVRSAIHCGRPHEVSAALAVAVATLAEPPERWTVAPSDDVFPHDFAPGFFNFRRYVELVTDGVRTDGGTPTPALVRLVLASLEHYVGCYAGDVDRFARAAALDPEFAAYRLSLARALLDRQDAGDLQRAVELLIQLTNGSTAFPEAFGFLDVLRGEGRVAGPALDAARAIAHRLSGSIAHHEDQRLGTLRAACVPGLARDAQLQGRADDAR